MSSNYYYVDEEPASQPSPKWWIGYVVGSVLLVLGLAIPCIGSGALLAAAVPGMVQAETVIASSGKSSLSVTKRERMVMWLEDTDPESATPPPVRPDLMVTVTGPGGSVVATSPAGEEVQNVSASNAPRSPIFVFTPSGPGVYTVDVKGTVGPSERLVATTDESLKAMSLGMGMMAFIALGLLLGVGGVVTLIITAVRHIKHRRAYA